MKRTALHQMFILCLIVICLTVLVFSARAVAYSQAAPFESLAAYAAVFPGESRQTVIAQGFACPLADYASYPTATSGTCVLQLRDGVFSQVTVVINSGLVRRVEFTMRVTSIQLGDLMLLWGTPHSRQGRHTVHFDWSNGASASARITASPGRISPFLPLHKLSFTAADPGFLALPDR